MQQPSEKWTWPINYSTHQKYMGDHAPWKVQELCAALKAAAVEAEGVYRRAEFLKWEEKVNPLTDIPYWQHRETLQVLDEPPREEDCEYVPRRPRA